MIRKIQKQTILTTFFALIIGMLSIPQKSEASHVMGGDLEIECLGDSVFEVSVDIYRDCRGIQVTTAPITFESNCGNIEVTLVEQEVRDITPVCREECSLCESNSGCFSLGIEVYELTGQVDLSDLMAQGCCDFSIEGFENCCRNDAIDNITSPSSSSYWMEHEFNPCNADNGCPSTPKFSTNPVAIACEGEDFIYNQGTATSPQDSVVYELVDPLQGGGFPVNWVAPWNKYEPLTYKDMNSPVYDRHSEFPRGFHFDQSTGDLKFRPVEVMTGLVSLEARQYRNGKQVSAIQRDVQIEVMDCNANNPPEASFEQWHEVCVGDSVIIPIEISDPDSLSSGDSVYVDWLGGIEGAEFTADSGETYAVGEFTWVPQPSDAGPFPHSFVFEGRDNNCPVTGRVAQSVMVEVKVEPIPEAEMQTQVLNTCGEVEFHANLLNVDSALFSWNIDGDSSYNQQTFTHQFSSPGNYPVELVVSNGSCNNVYFDTIEVPDLFDVDAGDDFSICNETMVDIQTTTQNAQGNINYSWNFPGEEDSVLSKKLSPGTEVIVEATDTTGCTASDTVNIGSFESPLTIDAGDDIFLCEEELVNIQTTAQNAQGDISYNWNIPGVGGSGFSATFDQDTTIIVEATDSLGCVASDTVNIDLLEVDFEPEIKNCNMLSVGATTDPEDSVNLTWNTWDGSVYQADSFEQQLPGPGLYHVSLTADAHGCQVSFEDSVYFHGVLDVELNDTTVCKNENLLISAETINPVSLPTYNWSTGHDSASFMLSADSDSTITVNVTDSLGCVATDTMQLTTIDNPSAPVITESNDTLYAGTDADQYIWISASADTLHQSSSEYFVPSSGNLMEVTAVNNGLCSKTSAPYNYTTFLNVPEKEASQIEIYPNPAGEELNIETPVAAHKYQITDLSGRTIAEHKPTNPDATISIDVSDLEAGTYFIRISMENSTYTGQWIKEE